jgi:hypothetical protein
MPRVHESIVPPQAGSTIAAPGIAGGAPARSAPASSEGPPPFGGPASQGPGNYLTGGLVELDPGPPSAEASGPGEWSGPVTPIPGPLGEDASLHEEEARCYLPSGSVAPEAQLLRGDGEPPKDPWATGLKPHGMGAGEEDQATSAPATPVPATGVGVGSSTPAPALTSGPKGDAAHVVRGMTDRQMAPRLKMPPKGTSERFT